jgi:nucleoside-diphosphate kinase
MIERSLVLLKPDAVVRGVTGEILHRFERVGLKIVGMKMVHAEVEFVKKHYLTTDEKLKIIGERTLADCIEYDIDVEANMGTKDPIEIGRQVWNWNVEFLSSGPVLAIVFEGVNSVQNIRNMVGSTVPSKAAPGTIRGDFSLDTAVGANKRKRTVFNLIHASGSVEEANEEIKLWFNETELYNYRRLHEDFYRY